jgi:nuclear pore complex protein Nup98-Nup96
MVQNFRITKENVATIDFHEPVDPSEVNFDKDVVLAEGLVDVYRNKRTIPGEGSGLNGPAVISMNGIWPKDQFGNRRRGTDHGRLSAFEGELRRFCARKSADFLFYLPDRGLFQFGVANFTNGPFDLP